MAISEREFYAAHGIDYDPAKWLQGYTDYILGKTLEDVKNEIASVSFSDNNLFPTSITNKLILIGCKKGLQVAQTIIDKHISDLSCEASTDENTTKKIGTESSDAI
jgi:hypothetical protein